MPETQSRVIDGRRLIWLTQRLWTLSAALLKKRVPIAAIAEFDQDCWFGGAAPSLRLVATHARRIYEADLSYPIILSSDGRLMDCGHRIAKAWGNGASHIDAVQFEIDPAPDQIT